MNRSGQKQPDTIMKENKLSIQNFIRLMFLYTIRYAVPYAPNVILYFLADVIGVLRKSAPEAQILKQELRKMLGDEISEEELGRIAVEGIANHKKDLFEIWSFPRLNKNRIKKYAYIEGKEHLDNALKNDKGALIAVVHFGSWKMIIAALAYEGYKVNQIGLDPRHFVDKNQAPHHNIIMEIEHLSDRSLPANFIYIGKFIRGVYKALAQNELVINSLDGFMSQKRLEVPFLNSKLSLALGPIIIAARSSAPLLPTFAVRQDDNRYKITIHEEIPLDKSLAEAEAVKKATLAYSKLFEEYVLRYPSHYCRSLYDRVRDPDRI